MRQSHRRITSLRSLLDLDPLAGDHRAVDAGADALIVSAGGGDAGIEAAAALLGQMREKRHPPPVFVRLSLCSAIDDALDRLLPAAPRGVALADGFTPAAVQALGVKLAVREARLGLAEGTFLILAEAGADAGGLLALPLFRDCSTRLFGFGWNADTLAGHCGAAPSAFADNGTEPSTVVRTLMVLGAAAAGVAAYDTSSAASGEALVRECSTARRLGFAGKIAASPAQVPIINAAFARPP